MNERAIVAGAMFAACITGMPPAAAQEWARATVDLPTHDLIEAIGEASLEHRTESLSEMIERPVDLNTASRTEIAAVPGFTDRTATRIVSFRRANGPFSSVDDIEDVPGVDADDLRRASPYVQAETIRRVRPRPQILVSQTFRRRVEVARGYKRTADAASYEGSPVSAKTKIQLSYRGFRGNLRMEKDAGEPLVWNSSERRLGVDHLAANLSYSGDGVIEQLVVGHYRLTSETGLLIGSPGIQSPERPLRHDSGSIRARSAPAEGAHLRGAAVTIRVLPYVRVTAALSARRRDARFAGTSEDRESVTLSSEDGLHRTSSEIDARGLLRERVLATAVRAHLGAVSFGVAAYNLAFSRGVVPSGRPDDRWAFRGNRQHVYSAHVAVERHNTICKGETTFTDRPAAAVIYCQWKPDKNLRTWFLARSYGSRRVGLLGSTYARSDGPPENETGFLIGFTRKIRARISFSVYADVWWSRWLRYQQHTPTSGTEATVKLDMNVAPAEATIRITTITRTDATTAATSGAAIVKTSGRTTEHRGVARMRLSPSNGIRLEARATIAQTHKAELHRGLISAAVSIRADAKLRQSLRLSAQATAFHAADGRRVYLVQPAMSSGFGIRSTSGRGQQWIALLTLDLTRALQIQARYAHTTRFDVTSTGSGLDETSGPRMREVGLQLRVRT